MNRLLQSVTSYTRLIYLVFLSVLSCLITWDENNACVSYSCDKVHNNFKHLLKRPTGLMVDKNMSFVTVASLYIGSNGSGYAYSHRGGDIVLSKFANNGAESVKTPTSVLLDPNGRFYMFGYEAEQKMSRLTTEEMHTGWRLFKSFNGPLLRKQVHVLNKEHRFANVLFINLLNENSIDAIFVSIAITAYMKYTSK